MEFEISATRKGLSQLRGIDLAQGIEKNEIGSSRQRCQRRKDSPMRRANNENRDGAVRQHLERFTSQYDRSKATPAMRSHDDQIAQMMAR
jgi:hypothetical protein